MQLLYTESYLIYLTRIKIALYILSSKHENAAVNLYYVINQNIYIVLVIVLLNNSNIFIPTIKFEKKIKVVTTINLFTHRK